LRSIIANLRHSHVWLTFPDWASKIVATPVHHQMHHSRDAQFSNINYANDCAFIDRMFGTLYIPTERDHANLNFGIDEPEQNLNPHSYWSCLFQPFINFFKHWKNKLKSSSLF
jgi:sterol desaturase/sphingolipid hydroxylase (fatty acid hydroxylase superfamily)